MLLVTNGKREISVVRPGLRDSGTPGVRDSSRYFYKSGAENQEGPSQMECVVRMS